MSHYLLKSERKADMAILLVEQYLILLTATDQFVAGAARDRSRSVIARFEGVDVRQRLPRMVSPQ